MNERANTATNTRLHFAALIILTILWALFFWRLLTPTLGDRAVFAPGDFTAQFWTFTDWQTQRMARGELPLWNPYAGAGYPAFADTQTATFYPLRWLAAFIAGPEGWSQEALQFEVAAHFWLMSVFTYAFFCGLVHRPAIAIFGSVLLTYSGLFPSYPMLQPPVLESAIWLPLALLAIHAAASRPRWRGPNIVLAAIALALSTLAGHPQTILHVWLFSILYLAWIGFQRGLRWHVVLMLVVLMCSLAGGIAAIQLLPALEFLPLSHRADQWFYLDKHNGYLPSDYLQLLWPRMGVWSPLYAGISAALLAASAVVRPRREHAFWIVTGAIAALLSLGGGSFAYDASYNLLPGFSLFRGQERIAYLFTFALVTLAVYEAARLTGETNDPRHIRRLTLSIALLIGFNLLLLAATELNALTAVPVERVDFAFFMLILFAGWLAWAGRYEGARWHIGAVLIVLAVVDGFTVGGRSGSLLPDIPENREAPPIQSERLKQVDDLRWRVDGAAGLQQRGPRYRIPDIYPVGPLYLDTISELREIPVDRFWEVLAVRYIMTSDSPPPGSAVSLIASGQNYDDETFRLYELTDPRPMAHLVYSYRIALDNPTFARQIMSDPFVDLRDMGVTLSPLPFILPDERPSSGGVEFYTMRTPEQFTMLISTPAHALLTLSVPYYPGWRATINGQPTGIYDTYAGLMGIALEPGNEQRIVFTFWSETLVYGAIISGVTLMLALIVSVGGIWWHDRQQSRQRI